MPLRLLTAADEAALETLYDARHPERVAEYGHEEPFAELRRLWLEGKLAIVVNDAAGVINGAAVLYNHGGRVHEFMAILLPAGTLNTTLRNRAFALIKDMVSRTGADFASRTFVGRFPAGALFDNVFNTAGRFAADRMVITDERFHGRVTGGPDWAVYKVSGANVQAKL